MAEGTLHTPSMDLPAALQFSRYATRMLAAHPEDAIWLAATLGAPLDWSSEQARVAQALAAADAAALAPA
ncbi:MAG TPA: hypothetical protein VFC24_00930, partial [Casimicrobiaceae bacterium]|nr:hypothetical protein [Casimicrobiaceae bacterium]